MRHRAAEPDCDVGMLLMEVATRLRAGADTVTAWRLTLERAGIGSGEGAVLDEHGTPLALVRLWNSRNGGARSADVRHGIPPAIAVCKLTHVSGAPAADILEACAAGITEAGEAAAARQAALAGPVLSAMMLAFLPVIGVLIGVVLGAEPVNFLVGHGLGRWCLAVGVACELAGIAWVKRLARSARVDA